MSSFCDATAVKLLVDVKARPLPPPLFFGTNRYRCEKQPRRKKEREKQHGAIIKTIGVVL